MKKLLLLVIVAFIYGCRQHDKEVINHLSYFAYQKGDSLFRLHNDSAFYYYNEAADYASDRLQKARAYNRMAAVQFNSADYFGCQETITTSQKLLDEKIYGDHPFLLSNYNLLGRSYFEQKNYDDAIISFEKATELQEKGQFNPTLLNNLAVAYQKKKDYGKAKDLLQLAIDSSKQDTLVYARALSNLARTKWLENPAYRAVPELLTALKLRGIKKERSGLKTSYSHLADYYVVPRPDSSLFYAKKMYQVAENADDTLEAIKKIVRIGTPKDAKDFSDIYYTLDDSLKQIRSTSSNQFAVIRYETEKNKAENMQLQRDNFKQRVHIWAITAGFVLLSLLGIAWYRRRKKRMERESRERIREHQLKTSKKVHDVVANGLYRIMTNLEHHDKIDREPLLDEIEVLYEQSRDISYDQEIHQSGEYATRIHRLFSSFGTADTKVILAGNQERTWNKLSTYQKKELEYVLQELMVNMSKHSHAQNVVVRFAEEKERLNIHYKDNGVGLLPTFEYGNGLQNTETRIKNIGGTITFDSMSGLKIDISLPIGKAND